MAKAASKPDSFTEKTVDTAVKDEPKATEGAGPDEKVDVPPRKAFVEEVITREKEGFSVPREGIEEIPDGSTAVVANKNFTVGGKIFDTGEVVAAVKPSAKLESLKREDCVQIATSFDCLCLAIGAGHVEISS